MSARLAAVTITGGSTSSRKERGTVKRPPTARELSKAQSWGRKEPAPTSHRVDGHNVAKVELVGLLQALLQRGRLKVVPTLLHAATLRDEMRGFQTKITDVGNETFSHRSGKHDDLLLAVAVALWVAALPALDRSLRRGKSPTAHHRG